ncbi:MAG TPA: vitamin B12-dependent ribonucleotide reductase [Candidatus Paceibacterota bacterium]
MRDEFNEALGLGLTSKTFFRAPEKIGALNNQIQDELDALNSKNKGLVIKNYFSKKDIHPYDEIEWEARDAKISSAKGETIFEQKGVEVPKFWSQTATDIVAEKYFTGHVGKPGREVSVKELINRVADTITTWGIKSNYFESLDDAQIFNRELKHLLVNQKGSFNSPVWFNVGVEKKPQCSACFILSVTDDKESISEWYKTEMFIFSGGSGSGINVSPLRSSLENISNRGKSSGPVSFMKGADAIAGTIRSGGKTRRAAKMVILNASHPDIESFIVCKWKEEEKAKKLIALGHDDAIDGEIYTNIFFQNANNSVRATDEFMNAVEEDGEWELKYVKTDEIARKIRARDLMRLISEAAWHCADPGMQFDSTINKWHTCPVTGPITASNPCSEYMHLDNSACNLASLNLLKFLKSSGEFDIESYKKAIRVFIIAQDIIVGHSSYPTEKIEKNAYDYRELGLGYTNLGALLMRWGYPYDSDAARAHCAILTSVLTGESYAVSAEIARVKGPFAGYEKNKIHMLNVIKMHGEEAKKIDKKFVLPHMWESAQEPWKIAYMEGQKYGIRNSQATVLAPTGTISFMMDADTTGIEPGFSLIAYKKMVGGGFLKIINQSVSYALLNLGYSQNETREIMEYILANDTIEGAPYIKEEHMNVFDCATNAKKGVRSIHYLGHVRMMSAAQPFISGAISKTVNLPESATVEDVTNTYMDAWKMGLKAIAIYRDNSKGSQPLNTSKTKGSNQDEVSTPAPKEVGRRKLPADVKSIRHKFSIAGHEGYIHCGLYEDGSLGEVFIRVAKEGSTTAGLFDAIGILMSVSLQSGVPVKTIIQKFIHSRFEPMGYTENKDILTAKSITDYIAKFLALKFLSKEEQMEMGIYSSNHEESSVAENETKVLPQIQALPEANIEMSNSPVGGRNVEILTSKATIFSFQDAPSCRCGSLMIRTGSCYTCPSCGENIGSCS